MNYPNAYVSDIEWTAMPATAKTNTDEKVKLKYNAVTSELEAYFDGYTDAESIVCKTYKFECVPVFKSLQNGASLSGSQKINVTLSIIDKAPSITAVAKGSINVTDRANTYVRYTVKKSNFFAGYNADSGYQTVAIEAPSKLGKNEIDGSEMFELAENSDAQFAANGTVDVFLKDSAEVNRGCKYVFRLAVLLENGEMVYSPDLKITPVQPNITVKQNYIPVLYKSVNLRKRIATITLNHSIGEIDSIKYNDAKNSKLPADLLAETVEEDKDLIQLTLDDGNIKTGTYTINFLVTYKGEMLEKDGKAKEYPVSIRVTVK